MALTKDHRYVTKLAEMSDCLTPNEAASKLILSSMELRLRAIISEGIKCMSLLNREILTIDCIDEAISDLRFEEQHFSQPYKAIKADVEDGLHTEQELRPFVSNKALTIDESIHQLLSLKVMADPELHLDWIQIDNKVPYTASNAYIKSMKQNSGQLSEKSLIMQKCEKKLFHGILIKEHHGSSMPKVVLT